MKLTPAKAGEITKERLIVVVVMLALSVLWVVGERICLL